MRIVFSIVVGLLFYSCAEENKEQKQNAGKPEMIRTNVTRDSARLVTLPTPMQVPTLLRSVDASYNRESLFPIISEDKSFFKSNLIFGVYLIDMAYASAFKDKQTSMIYISKCKRLGDQMGLGTKIDQKMIDRFERSIDNPDSTGRMILDLYEMGHEQFNESGREGIGLLMILGCLMEGIHLSLEELSGSDMAQFSMLIDQQTHYVNNLIIALDGYQIPAEISHEYELLESLATELNELKTEQNEDDQIMVTLDPDKMTDIKGLVHEFRLSIQV